MADLHWICVQSVVLLVFAVGVELFDFYMRDFAIAAPLLVYTDGDK